MKQIKLIVLAILLIFLYGCNKEEINQVTFEIYLIADELPSEKNIDINKLTLEETPILTLNDIQKYYWDEQAFVTKKDLLLEQIKAHNNQYVPVGGLSYIVVVNGKRIYMGKFWTALSSVWAYSPSIMVDMTIGTDIEQYNVQPDQQLYIVYWNDDESATKEAVFDKRIYEVLKQNNLLVEVTN